MVMLYKKFNKEELEKIPTIELQEMIRQLEDSLGNNQNILRNPDWEEKEKKEIKKNIIEEENLLEDLYEEYTKRL